MLDRRLAWISSTYLGGTDDARRLLMVSVLTGASSALFTINFVPYLAATGLTMASVASIVAVASAVAGGFGLLIGAWSRVVGRRVAYLTSIALSCLGLLLLGLGSGPLLVVAAATFVSGQQGTTILEPAMLRERSHAHGREGLFAAQFAIVTGMGAAAAGLAAGWFSVAGPATDSALAGQRLLFLGLSASLLVAVIVAMPISDDRRLARRARAIAAASTRASGLRGSMAIVRLLLPWMLIAIGSGQVMQFLSYFLVTRFLLDTATVNLIFAAVGGCAAAAILLQPFLVARVGRIPSIVLVQGASIPMILAIAFGPLALVIVAVGIRSALMEAGHPIYNLSVMEAVPGSLRPVVSSIQMLILAVGAAIGAAWLGQLQQLVGFDTGFAIAWITMAILYAAAMLMLPMSLQPIRMEARTARG